MKGYLSFIKNVIPGIIIIMMLPLSAAGQDTRRIGDLESWTELGLEKRMMDKALKINLSLEMRLDENSSHLNNYFTNLSTDYKIRENVIIGLGYRYIRDNKDEDGYQNMHRLNLDLQYKNEIDRLELRYRLRLQRRKDMPFGNMNLADLTNKVRLKTKASYNFRNWKLDPAFSAELFYTSETFYVNYLESINELKEFSGFEKVRLTLETSYSFKKFGELRVFYRIEREFKSYPGVFATPGTFHIIGSGFTIKL